MISFASLPFWRITHDSVLIQYITLLIDEFGVRLILKFLIPHCLVLYFSIYLLGKCLAIRKLALQFFNFLFCSVFILSNFILLKGFSLLPRLLGSIFFIYWYLSFGHEMSLERDFTAAFFIALSYLVSYKLKNRVISFVILGLLMGVTFSIKPHLAIGAPIFFYILNKHSLEGFWSKIGGSFFGFYVTNCRLYFLVEANKGVRWIF